MIDLSKMNPQQREAVLTTEGPLLILAGAGSGKTRVLTHRVAHLVLDKGVDPENVLAITFTNKATREMKERITALVGRDAAFIKVGTFHRTCLDILRAYPELVGLQPKFNLVGQDDAKKIITKLCEPAELEPGPTMSAISRAKNELVSAQEYLRTADKPHKKALAHVYADYDSALRASGVLDLDDILVECHRLLNENPHVLAMYQDLFKYIHVDEYQDTCRAQYRIVSLLAEKHQNLMVVGDDDQAIYGFRAADIRNILNFEKDYPKAKVIVLGTNYRSTSNILSLAGSLIMRNQGRREKKLDTPNPPGTPIRLVRAESERAEADFVANATKALIRSGVSPAEVAVLYRVATLSSDLESAFLRAGIKYEVVRGIRYVDRKIVRDALAYINTVAHPEDEISLRRIANVPKRGLGEGTLAAITTLGDNADLTLRQALERVAEGSLPMAPKGRAAALDLTNTLTKVQEATRKPKLASQVRAILEATGLLGLVPQHESSDQDSAADLLKLVDIADALSDEKPDADLTDLTDFLALQSEADEGDNAASRVKLLTVHASKGLEFHSVFVVGLEDGIMPHRRACLDPHPSALEEERRLAYVAITRAKTNLTLSFAAGRRLYGERQASPSSRFLREVPDYMFKKLKA